MIHENLIVSGTLRAQAISIPTYGRANRPATPLSGSIYHETSSSGSAVMVYTGIANSDNGWEQISQQVSPNTSFKYRQIIAYGYVAGGYISSSPWKTVHKTVAATDQTTNVGDLLDYPANYTKGACSRTILYVFSANTGNGFTGPSTVSDTYTTAVNMTTDTNYAHQSKFDITTSRADHGVMFKETAFAYIFGGLTTTVDVFNLNNETCLSSQNLSTIGGSSECSAFSDENYGYGWSSSEYVKMNFTNVTFNTSVSAWSAHGQQKGISSKVGKGYTGNEGSYNGGINFRRWQFSTDTNIGNVAKPETTAAGTGEENYTMGQDWQYMLGNYNGVQNNNSHKFYYATDSGTWNPSGLSPTAHAGQSSAICGWR